MYSTSVEADAATYVVGAITVGQMQELTKLREKDPKRTFMDDNIYTIACCLENGDSTQPHGVKDVQALPWPTYKKLIEAAGKVSDFELAPKTLGESVAATVKP